MKKLYRSTLDLDKEQVERFRKFYPQKGSLSWFINSCLRTFNQIHNPTSEDEINACVEEALVAHLNNGDERK